MRATSASARVVPVVPVVTLVLPHQRRDVTRLMAVAGITPTTTRVRPGGAELNRITGAQAPSGVPVVLAPPVTQQPAARPSSASRGRRSRPSAQGRRRAPAKGNGR